MANRIKFGIRIHQSGYRYEALRDVWREADRLGFYSASLYDLLNAPTLECWTTISALATETRSIRLVPLALANLYRHPALLAKMVDYLFETPATTIPFMKNNLGIAYNSAKNNINKLIDLGILTPIEGNFRSRIFLAREIIRTISDDEEESKPAT